MPVLRLLSITPRGYAAPSTFLGYPCPTCGEPVPLGWRRHQRQHEIDRLAALRRARAHRTRRAT